MLNENKLDENMTDKFKKTESHNPNESKLSDLLCGSDKRKQKGGWAPGNYSHKCFNCNNEFNGDKRAIICADCAYMPIFKNVLNDYFYPIVWVWRKLFKDT